MSEMTKEIIDNAEFKGIVKPVMYLVNPDSSLVGVNEVSDYITRTENGVIYKVGDGPFSAKGFRILDQEVSESPSSPHLVAQYIVQTEVLEQQFDKYKEMIVDPIIAKFWEESVQSAKQADEYVKSNINIVSEQ